jgi:hypothetical protein
VRADGALVRYLEVLPRKSAGAGPRRCGAAHGAFAAVLSRLPAGQALQVYVQARPLALDAVRE